MTFVLGGCATDRNNASGTIASGLPVWAGGEPANVPPRPATEAAYPAINAPVPQREAKPLTTEEQTNAIADLVAARNRAVARAKAAHKDEDIATDEGLASARGKFAGHPANSN
jgi:hypothetical protein